jgi:HEAT repeat protein
MADAEKIRKLMKKLQEDYHYAEFAINQIAALGEVAVAPLISALHTSNANLHRHAAYALGKMDAQYALEPLIDCLAKPHYRVRASAVFALGRIGDKRAIPYLIDAIKDDYWGVRYEAVHALSLIDDERAIEPIVSALDDNERKVRNKAKDILHEKNDPRSIAPLISLLERGLDLEGSVYAIWLLGLMGGSRAVPPLIEALQAKDMEVRYEAARILGEIGDASSVEALKKSLSDAETLVSNAAREALRKLGHDPDTPG